MAVVNYTSPQTWTDGMDWNNISQYQARYCDALLMAITERVDAVRPQNTPAWVKPYQFRLLSYDIISRIHAMIWNGYYVSRFSEKILVDYYINHTIPFVTGTIDDFVFWSKDSICSYLQIDKLIEPSKYQFNLTGWILQTKKIINLLRWYGASGSQVMEEGYYSGTVDQNFTTATSAMDVTAAITIAGVHSTTASSGAILRNNIGNQYSSPWYFGTCDISNYKLTAYTTQNFAKNIEVYIYATDDPAAYGWNYTFDTAGLGYVRGYNLAEISAGYIGYKYTSGWLGNSTAVPSYPPSATSWTGQLKGWADNPAKNLIIQKFDIPNGFKFKNW